MATAFPPTVRPAVATVTAQPSLCSSFNDGPNSQPDGHSTLAWATTVGQVAVYPEGFTHVWFGNANSTGSFEFELADNWLGVADLRPSVPAGQDSAYVPYYGVYNPQLRGDHMLARLAIQQGTTFDLNDGTLTVNGSLEATSASLTGGRVVVMGTGSVVSGFIAHLTVGNIDRCGTDSAVLNDLYAPVLILVCRATVGSSVTAELLNTLDHAGTSQLVMTAARRLESRSTCRSPRWSACSRRRASCSCLLR